MLRVEDLHKSFDKFKAVNGAYLAVEKGQLVAVIGPNGAGKTTLFNLITGQLKPDSGKILLNDEDIGKLPPHVICRKGIARSFQIANVFHRLSVFRNVQISVLSRRKLSDKLFQPAARLAVRRNRDEFVPVWPTVRSPGWGRRRCGVWASRTFPRTAPPRD